MSDATVYPFRGNEISLVAEVVSVEFVTVSVPSSFASGPGPHTCPFCNEPGLKVSFDEGHEGRVYCFGCGMKGVFA